MRRASTAFRLLGLAFLVLGAFVRQRPYLPIGLVLLVIGWVLLIRERRRHRSG